MRNQSFGPSIELAMGLTHRAMGACCLMRIRLHMVGKLSFQHWRNPTQAKMELN